ncbi:MAG: hypothetical protein MI922_07330 [Bacteroidales bacterium]|nr:hypothetical protein [Bacteroidales bacterium]
MNVISDLAKHKDAIVRKLSQKLRKMGVDTIFLKDENALNDFLSRNIPEGSLVGLDDSVIHSNYNIQEVIKENGSRIYYSYNGTMDYNRNMETFEEHTTPDFYVFADGIRTSSADLGKQKVISETASKNNKHPKHIIAITALKHAIGSLEDSLTKLRNTIIEAMPPGTHVTIALMSE